jgi:TRAP-type C4-dicarboxylate transport system permease small subunit
MKILRKLDDILAGMETGILVLALSVMIFMSFLQVILRNFFSSGIIWADTFLRHLVLWVTFLGASLATRENRHINIDIFSRLLSPAARRPVQFITNLFASGIAVLLARAAYVFVRDEKAFGSTTFLNLPLWIVVTIIAIGFVLIAFRFILKAILAWTDHQQKGTA